VLAATLVSVAPVLAAEDVGIITGSDKGTYYQFGLDVQRLVKESGINVTVHPSKGSIENIFAVYQRPGVQTGIVQSDVPAVGARLQRAPARTRHHLPVLPAAGPPNGLRAARGPRLRRPPAERSGAHPERQENEDGLSAL